MNMVCSAAKNRAMAWCWGCAAVVALTVLVPAAAASPGAAWMPAWGLQLPANAYSGTQQSVSLGALACGSARSCAAVGTYVNSADQRDPVVESKSNGNWLEGAEAPLPNDAVAAPNVTFGGIACTGPDACDAVGSYAGTSQRKALVLSDTRNAWSDVQAPLPSDAASSAASLAAIACVLGKTCTAVGTYVATQGGAPLILTGSGKIWHASTAALPATQMANGPWALHSVACASVGSCVAGGFYEDRRGETSQQGLLLSESAGSWRASEAPLPTDAATGTSPNAEIGAVSCPAAADCAAIGSYLATDEGTAGLLLTESSGVWSAEEAPLPPDAGTDPRVQLNSISCPAAGTCVVVGRYYDNSSNQHGLVLTETDATWTATTAALPAGTPAGSPSDIYSVSCAAPGSCAAVGRYNDAQNQQRGLLLNGSEGAWSAQEAVLFTGAGPADAAQINAVACPQGGGCSAIGVYAPGPGQAYGLGGLLLTRSAPAPAVRIGGRPSTRVSSTSATIKTGITVSCPAGGAACTVVERVATGSRTVGAAKFAVAAGASRSAAFKLNRTGRALLARHGKLGVTVSVTATVAGGPSRTGRKTFTVRRR